VRQTVLDRLIEPLIKLAEVSYVVPWLHGCSTAAVRGTMTAHPEIWSDPKLDWQKFIMFHGPVFIDAFRAALIQGEKQQTQWYESSGRKYTSMVASVFQRWFGLLQGKQRKHMTNARQLLLERSEGHGLSGDIIKLVQDFPIFSMHGQPPGTDHNYRYDYPVVTTPSTLTWFSVSLPQFITTSYAFWLHKHPTEMAEIFKLQFKMRRVEINHPSLQVKHRITNHKGDWIRDDIKTERYLEIQDSIIDTMPHGQIWNTRDLPISFVTTMYKHMITVGLTRRLFVRPPPNRVTGTGHPYINDRGDDYHMILESVNQNMITAWTGLKRDNDKLTLAQLIENTLEVYSRR
jgi:hypothetical protein